MNTNLLRAKIVEKGYTQKKLAAAIGISELSLSRKMCGKREFRLSEVDGICRILGIDNPTVIFLCKSSQISNDKKGGLK